MKIDKDISFNVIVHGGGEEKRRETKEIKVEELYNHIISLFIDSNFFKCLKIRLESLQISSLFSFF